MPLPANRIVTLLVFLIVSLQVQAQKLAVLPYATGFSSAIDLKHCGDDRLFVACKDGLVRVVNSDGTLRPTPFLDISAKVHVAVEDGLLGIAFSPNYKNDGKFYLDYNTIIAGTVTTIIEQYKVSATDSNVADLSSAITILTQAQPFDNHLGGNLMFGKDGYLYINFGDGDVEGDTNGNGQNLTTFQGKILRLDVSNCSKTDPYSVPATNPFYSNGTPGIKKEIWAYGVRNPWRSSVDRITGDLWISDVGQNAHEEIDYQPVNRLGGVNYGWNTTEGSYCYNPRPGCNFSGITLPVYNYPHPVGNAVIGGYVSRTAQSKSLFGTYIFSDFTGEWVAGFKQSGGVISGGVTQFLSIANGTKHPISFGEDRVGDLYMIFLADETIYKLQDTSYLRHPKAYFKPADQGNGSFLLQGLEGRNLKYQWLKDNEIIPGANSPDYIASDAGIYQLMVTNSLNLSDTSDVFTLGVLPLNLTTFTAQRISVANIGLQWKTASEQNVSGFNILRKQQNETGFSNIGFVATKSVNGISNRELAYTFIDSFATGNAKLFYRLQVQSKDGGFSYSDIRTINTTGTANAFTFFPNPAKGQVIVYIDKYTKPVKMIMYDNTGKKVKEQSIYQQSTTVALPGLRGLYFVQLSNIDGSEITRKRLLIE